MSSTNIMVKKHRVYDAIEKLILTAILVVIMFFLTNVSPESISLIIARNILALVFILFFSGYILVAMLFQEERLEFSEFLTHSIGLSISISILCAMIIHFIGAEVNIVNIINLISLTTIILAFLNFLRALGLKKHW